MIFRPSQASIPTHPDWWECRVQIPHPLSSLSLSLFPPGDREVPLYLRHANGHHHYDCYHLTFHKPSYVVGRALDLSLCKVA